MPMAKQITIAELITLAHDIEPDGGAIRTQADALASAIESMAQPLAEAIAERLGIECGETNYGPEGFGGICTPFYAARIGQACPEVMRDYDTPEWGARDGTDLDDETGEETTS